MSLWSVTFGLRRRGGADEQLKTIESDSINALGSDGSASSGFPACFLGEVDESYCTAVVHWPIQRNVDGQPAANAHVSRYCSHGRTGGDRGACEPCADGMAATPSNSPLLDPRRCSIHLHWAWTWRPDLRWICWRSGPLHVFFWLPADALHHWPWRSAKWSVTYTAKSQFLVVSNEAKAIPNALWNAKPTRRAPSSSSLSRLRTGSAEPHREAMIFYIDAMSNETIKIFQVTYY